MLDTGNFMLVNSQGSPRWQSFQVPSDTILPSQVLDLGSHLSAHLMDDDYSSGRFTLLVQTDGNLVLYTVAAPSGFQYDAYWSSNTPGNGSKLVFNENGITGWRGSDGRAPGGFPPRYMPSDQLRVEGVALVDSTAIAGSMKTNMSIRKCPPQYSFRMRQKVQRVQA
ncbi:unnamed protein product [Musa acuminata subsp. malaccensis]|uniref:(wild Malaysian banana) hypothetical protein n=1 Tax=Musa acuminata subsp. malaccensis TaxID=214687 RepID=A0A8D6ZSP1_MUSAM|nr:unnamed protein product [Musa acuminata subsp. malaccensis]